MSLRTLVQANGATAIALGAALTLFVQPGAYDLPGTWHSFSMLRFAGVVLTALGIVLWAVSDAVAMVERRAALGLALAHVLAAFTVWFQQLAIWNTTGGLLTAAYFGVFALAYALAALRAPRSLHFPAA